MIFLFFNSEIIYNQKTIWYNQISYLKKNKRGENNESNIKYR